MKKIGKIFFGLGAVLLGIASICSTQTKTNIIKNDNIVLVKNEDPEPEPPIEILPRKVNLKVDGSDFGTAELWKGETKIENETLLNVGDVIEIRTSLNEEHKFYSVGYVKVDNTNITLNENNQYIYTIPDKEGADLLFEVKFSVDFNKIFDYYTSSQFWNTNLIFSVITWIFNSGILVVIVRYFLKDKKLIATLKNQTDETLNKIVPDIISKTTNDVILPLYEKFAMLETQNKQAMSTLAKCFALAQEDTPDARLAIIEALSKLQMSDNELLETIKKEINEVTANAKKEIADSIARLESIKTENEKIVEEVEPATKEKEKEEEKHIETAD